MEKEQWINSYQMSKRLKISADTAEKWAREAAGPKEAKVMRSRHGHESLHYRWRVFRRVENRVQTIKRRQQLSAMTLEQAAECLAVAPRTARQLLDRPGVKRVPISLLNNRTVLGYKREVVLRVKRELIPVAGSNMVCAQDLVLITGWSHKTVVRRLIDAKLEGEFLRAAISGKSALFYEEDAALRAVGKSKRDFLPAGDWRTKSGMAAALGRSVLWVNPRIRRPRFANALQIRLDDGEHPMPHWPPWVFMSLFAESEILRGTEKAA
jgi:hypothetical protein